MDIQAESGYRICVLVVRSYQTAASIFRQHSRLLSDLLRITAVQFMERGTLTDSAINLVRSFRLVLREMCASMDANSRAGASGH